MSAGAQLQPYANNFEHLADELRWLDVLIRLRVKELEARDAAHPDAGTSRQVSISPDEFERLLGSSPGECARHSDVTTLRSELDRLWTEINVRVQQSQERGTYLALPRLGRLFGLSAFDLETVVICLAPELSAKYDQLYGYLQDDTTRPRPSVDLVANLLFEKQSQRWGARNRLADGSTLFRAGLIRKVQDPRALSGSNGRSHFFRLDSRIADFLTGASSMDSRLQGCAILTPPNAGDVRPELSEPASSLLRLIQRRQDSGTTPGAFVVYLHGPGGVGKREAVDSVCHRLNAAVLTIDAELLLSDVSRGPELLHAAFRESLLQGAMLHVSNAQSLDQESSRPILHTLNALAREHKANLFLTGEIPWRQAGSFGGCNFQQVALKVPAIPERAQVWSCELEGTTQDTSSWAAELARRFRLTPGQIRAAVTLAENHCQMASETQPLTLAGLSSACRQQSNHKLAELALKIEPKCGWRDIVLPDAQMNHLRELCDQVRHHYTVWSDWGFERKLSRGKGLSALFSGPSGTGKTMGAEVLAYELGLDLYKVDLSGVVSKYIGETEKNLGRIFEEAERSNAILFFDEADALFGKRTEVTEARDRYANIEVSYLLQRMEEYEGVVILATNLHENMDDAFTRRIRFVIEFPFPDETSRRRIWQSQFPPEAPVSKDVDFDYLAREFQVAGGNIKNIALNAAFLAAARGEKNPENRNGNATRIGMQDFFHGARREFAKMGKPWPMHA
jgi:ATP-dependent 26S proteasome regulatory subunit